MGRIFGSIFEKMVLRKGDKNATEKF